MTARSILLHRGGYGAQHRYGVVTVLPYASLPGYWSVTCGYISGFSPDCAVEQYIKDVSGRHDGKTNTERYAAAVAANQRRAMRRKRRRAYR